jgi:hypothetical protein
VAAAVVVVVAAVAAVVVVVVVLLFVSGSECLGLKGTKYVTGNELDCTLGAVLYRSHEVIRFIKSRSMR